MKRIICLSLVILGLSGCLESFAAGKKKHASMKNLDGSWQVHEIQGKAVEADENVAYVNLQCAKKKMNGFAGCNYIHGGFQLNTAKEHLQFGPIASTRMACPQGQTESTVLDMLQKTVSFRIETEEGQDRLVLFDQDGKTLLKLDKRMPLDGKWQVSKVFDSVVPQEAEEIFLVFNSSRKIAYGYLGCNSYKAEMTCHPQRKSLVRFGSGISTMRMCERMETERLLMEALSRIVSYKKFSDRKAILCNEGGKVLIELAR